MERGLTQEGTVYPKIFNILVDAVVKAVPVGSLRISVGTPQLWMGGRQSQHCFLCGKWLNIGVQSHLGTYNPDRHVKDVPEGGNTEIPGQDQSNGVHPRFNLGKTGHSGVQDESDGRRRYVLEWKRTRVSCAECRVTMSEYSLHHHMERSHGIVLPQNRGVDIGGGVPETYVVSFLWVLKLVDLPVDECPERVKNQGRLREHLIYQHWE